MAHEVSWMKANRVLYANYKGHQTTETITACLDDMVRELDTVEEPVIVLINWLEVTETDPKALFNVQGHRAYSHPMAARGVLVGMPGQAKFENEVTSIRTRESKNTQYYDTLEEALHYLRYFLSDDFLDTASEA
ncbi:MAG: hypothetical protein Q9P44_16695 [Anaerolineae bacterium]|nr:hypothetical protein [Anaerolineae bacterium]